MIRDYALAFAHCSEAASHDDAEAQYYLAVMYGLGLGVAQDYAAAVRWYRSAAELGEVRAQSGLGFMYGTGRGVPQDFVQAYAWYNLAAAAADEVARRNRDAIAAQMSANQVEHAQQLSTELFDRIERRSG